MKKPLAVVAGLCVSLLAIGVNAQSAVIQNPPRALSAVRSAETVGDDSTLTANDAGSVVGSQTSFESNPAPDPPESSPGNGNSSPPPPPVDSFALEWVGVCMDSTHDGQDVDSCVATTPTSSTNPGPLNVVGTFPGASLGVGVYTTCGQVGAYEMGPIHTNIDGFLIVRWGYTCCNVDTTTNEVSSCS